MASGTITGSGWGVYAVIEWSSTKGTGGSTVNATLYAQNESGWYWNATVNNGYSITINGSSSSGSTSKLSSTKGGRSTIISKSLWVVYTGDKTITISGTMDCSNIWSNSKATYIGTRSVSGSATLDKIGSVPTGGTITAPTTAVISETSSSITVKWNAGSSYNGTLKYRVDVSINGGAYDWVSGDLPTGTTSWTYTIPNKTQGTTYQFRIDTGNDIGWSGHSYSGVVTINKLNAPTIGTLNTYNPYVNSTLSVPLSGGSQSNSGTFKRYAALYYGSTLLANCDTPSDGNTNASITYSAANFISKLGTTKYSDTFTIKAWIQNSNGTKSSVVSKNFTVNINSDGGATPTIGSPTFSGGALGNPSTCFVAGVSTITVTSATASLRRSPSGTTLSYKIACTDKSTVSGSSASFDNLSAGTKTVTITVTDSRGLSTSVTKQFVVQSYSPPSIKEIKGERLDSPNTSGKITYTLSYSPIYQYTSVTTKGNQLNGIDTQEIYKNSTWSSYTSGTEITGLDTQLSYTFQLRVSDKLKTTTYTQAKAIIPTIIVLFSMRKWGVGINCIPESGYSLCVSGKAKIDGTLDVTGNINGNASTATIATTIKDSYDGNAIDVSYGETTKTDISYLACWDGHHLSNITLDIVKRLLGTMTPSSHTHSLTDCTDWSSYIYSAKQSRTANTVLAAPDGSSGTATFRKLVANDLPSHTHSYLPLSGGTLSGTLTVNSPIYVDSSYNYYFSDGNALIWSGVMDANRVKSFQLAEGGSGSTGYYIHMVTNRAVYGINIFASDLSLKNSIKPSTTTALDKVNQIKLYDFYWNDTGGHNECGYISQQLEVVDESLVTRVKDDNENEILQPNETTIIPLLTKSIQELSDEISKLKEGLYGQNT